MPWLTGDIASNQTNPFWSYVDSGASNRSARVDYINENFGKDPDATMAGLTDSLVNGLGNALNQTEAINESKQYNSEESRVAFERQKELMEFQYELQKKLRSSQMQDTIEDLRKAGINPAVFFSYGGQANSSPGISSGSVNAASIGNPNQDTISSLVSSAASVLAAIATNKNADTAVIRSLISGIGNIFSFGAHGVTHLPTNIIKNQIGF